ncbi:UNKNOWN [Stylonychia lemnae]|uniref:Uncharacterized protein n=1 Tax=Stylonychia lemnae TaxID=5949 RepID=A0A078A027_STYLE|nr:UNKNOWN [Stylonychia lemnae]|eukprot:CDW75232.1 UNKNOWN [Stylonychia lemnae]
MFKKQKQSLIDLPEVVIRDRNNLDDYLYQPNTLFDYIDIVFVDGDGSLLPWQKKCDKLSRLFKMCKITNKCLFAAGFGMQMLIYFCATNFAQLKVLNNNEKGGALSGIQDMNSKILPTLEKNQVFLDNLTGDYYQYEREKNEWKPVGNVGLHYSRAMASHGGLTGGDLIKKVSTYTEKNNFNKPQLFFSKLTDVKCSIKKQYISHPLLQQLPQEFVVDNHNSWDPHPVNITNIQQIQTNYDTLAESERGPQIVQHMNTVAVQFHIDRKYKESLTVLQNFIIIKLGLFQSQGKIDFTLDQAYLRQFVRSQWNNKNKLKDREEGSQTLNSDFEIYKRILAFGYGIFEKMRCCYRRQQCSKLNSNSSSNVKRVNQKRINLDLNEIIALKGKQITHKDNAKQQQYCSAIKLDSLNRPQEKINFQTEYDSASIIFQGSMRPISAIPRKGGLSRVGSAKSNLREKPRSTLRHLRNYQIEKEFQSQLKSDAEQYLWKNQKELRQMLHPTLCEEFLPEDRDMTTKQNSLISRNVTNQTPSRRVFNRFKEFQQLPQYDIEKPIIRISSPYVGCEEEQTRKRDREIKQKSIVPQDFKTSFGKASINNNTNFIPNYVTMDPSQPPLLHKFRQDTKDQWLKGTFKL